MTSQKRYYELKKAGICTKCAKNEIGSSPSAVRCIECYEKYMEANKKRKETRKLNNTCIQCGENGPVGNSKYCISCRQYNSNLKKNPNKQIALFNEKNQNCRVCDSQIDTLGVVCQNCLSTINFSKTDAVKRYSSQCYNCNEQDVERLRLVSSDISQPMRKGGSELYKIICYSTTPPSEYRVACYTCYWEENISYVNSMREFFNLGFGDNQDSEEDDDDDDNEIDAEYSQDF
jgi:hypothetical protein